MKLLLLIVSIFFIPIAYGQKDLRLEEALKREFSENSTKDGRWVFYSETASIEKIEKPVIKSSLPNYDLFQVTLVNFLGYHRNEATCLILFDSLKSRVILVEPLWYSGISKSLKEVFIGRKFENKESLLSFLDGINDLMGIGSGYKFRNTGFSDSLITYDLGYFKGDTYTTGGSGTSSTVRYNEDGIWRKIEITINKLKIIRYTSINPKTGDKEIIE